MTTWNEAYDQAAMRCLADGQMLKEAGRYANACHLFGLAAKCALKAAMANRSGAKRELPHKHLPELKDDAWKWLSGRRFDGLRRLLGRIDYMQDWQADNRYWPNEAFSATLCDAHHDHARRTLIAVGLGARI